MTERFLAWRFWTRAFRESLRSIEIRKDRSTIESPNNTWKNDSQECGKPKIGRRAMRNPRARMILLFGMAFIIALFIFKDYIEGGGKGKDKHKKRDEEPMKRLDRVDEEENMTMENKAYEDI